MANSITAPLPATFRPIQHYLKIADEHDNRDAVIAYYCRLYALQRAMEIDKKSADCRVYLIHLMDSLEKMKLALAGNDSIQNETVGQAHMENYALKHFLYADNKDRASQFDKNLVKSFYTAGMLFDVLSVFGEQDEEIEKNKKYAKWKAAYIHKCLKSGEAPMPGPMNDDDEGAEVPPQQPGPSDFGSYSQPGPSGMNPNVAPYPNAMNFHPNGPAPGQQPDRLQKPPSGSMAPPTTPQDSVYGNNATSAPGEVSMYTPWKPPDNPAGVTLTTQDYQKAIKFCKFASSALQYEDSKTAIDNLQKALTLLTTAHNA